MKKPHLSMNVQVQQHAVPYLNNEELPLKKLPFLSIKQLHAWFDQVQERDGIQIFKKKGGNTFLAGVVHAGSEVFWPMVEILSRPQAYPVAPTQLKEKSFQVSMVNVNEEDASTGKTRWVYKTLSELYDIVSDHEQYLNAKDLWKSLARNNLANIYVFDGTIGDYVQDETTKRPLKVWNSIKESFIWGQTAEHRMRLLVATQRELS